MFEKEIMIGRTRFSSTVLMAPLAGYTCFPFQYSISAIRGKLFIERELLQFLRSLKRIRNIVIISRIIPGITAV